MSVNDMIKIKNCHVGYCSFYGKKMDPEPGRCKRTDGKKRCCSKDAYVDSKYCERHMNCGRNRSRKLVESSSQTISPSLSIGAGSASGGSGGGGSGVATFQNRSIHGYGNPQGGSLAASRANYYADNIPFGIPNKDYRCAQGTYKAEIGDPNHFSGVSVANNAWPTLASRAFPPSFPSNEYASGIQHVIKQEGHSSLRPFFDKWPKARDSSWSGLDDEIRSNQAASFSTTQLSISTPVESSDFSTTSSRSPQSEKCI